MKKMKCKLTANGQWLIAVLLLFGSLFTHEASAQTVSKLIKKYRDIPGVEYADSSETFKRQLIKEIANNNPELKEDIKKNVKGVKYLSITNNQELGEQLTEDIRNLKGYETLVATTHNPEKDDDANPLKTLFQSVLNPSIGLSYFGIPYKDRQKNPIIVFRFGPSLIAIFIEGKIKTTDLFNSFDSDNLISFDSNDDDDDDDDDEDAIDFSSLKNDGEVLFVINGVEHPELKNYTEAHEYMKQHDIQINHMGIITGEEKDKKYPDTDKKMVVEYKEENK
ncbi:MAG: hypothetical protein Q4A08_00645 [Bacteroidales bacterium]|nr:hypothetical protein [Bacteroidales bacterium]